MASSDRSRSPTSARNRPVPSAPRQDLPRFGPMGAAVRTLQNMPRPQFANRWPTLHGVTGQFGAPPPAPPSSWTRSPHPFPPSPAPTLPHPSIPGSQQSFCSPTQPCSAPPTTPPPMVRPSFPLLHIHRLHGAPLMSHGSTALT